MTVNGLEIVRRAMAIAMAHALPQPEPLGQSAPRPPGVVLPVRYVCPCGTSWRAAEAQRSACFGCGRVCRPADRDTDLRAATSSGTAFEPAPERHTFTTE